MGMKKSDVGCTVRGTEDEGFGALNVKDRKFLNYLIKEKEI